MVRVKNGETQTMGETQEIRLREPEFECSSLGKVLGEGLGCSGKYSVRCLGMYLETCSGATRQSAREGSR